MADIDAQIARVLTLQEAILAKLEQGKDRWDKAQVILTAISGILLVSIGGVYTFLQHQQEEAEQRIVRAQQTRVQELQSLSAFMPYLTSEDEERKRLAILAINRLGSTELATALAMHYRTPGTLEAIRSIAVSPFTPVSDRQLAEKTLQFLRQVPEGGARLPGARADTVVELAPQP